MKSMNNTVGHKTVMAFLFAFATLGLFSQELDSLVKQSQRTMDGKINIQPFELYARKDISGSSSNYVFLDNTQDKIQGICNVDKARLPSKEAFVFSQVGVFYKTDAAADKAGEVLYDAAVPAALRNADLVIEQDGREVLNIPIASLNNSNAAVTTSDDFYELGSLACLADNTAFEFHIKYPPGVTVPAGTPYHYLEVRLKGWKTGKKVQK